MLAHGFTAGKDDLNGLEVAAALSHAGFDVVTYDARGHGDSSGECTLGDAERLDVASAVAVARTRSGRTITVGASMGAIAVLRHAATDPDLDGVVAVSCPARWRLHSLRSLLGAVMTRTPLGRRMLRRHAGVRLSPEWSNPLAPEQLAGGVRAPLAIVHGRDDRFIPASEALRLHDRAERAGRVSRLQVVAGMGHAFDPAGVAPIVNAVEWALARGRRPALSGAPA